MDPSDTEPWTTERVRALGLHTSVSIAADILGIGRTTAYGLIARHEFPITVVRAGRRLIVPTIPLLALLEGARVPGESES